MTTAYKIIRWETDQGTYYAVFLHLSDGTINQISPWKQDRNHVTQDLANAQKDPVS